MKIQSVSTKLGYDLLFKTKIKNKNKNNQQHKTL